MPKTDVRLKPGYLPTLDGWRAVAITAVLFNHGATHEYMAAHPWPRFGVHGVNLFFAISGLLITARMLAELRKSGRISLRAFYVRRVFRIFPPYYTYLLVIALLSGLGLVMVAGSEWRSSLLFYRNYIPADAQAARPVTGHFWSLAVEEHFYLIWPLVLVTLGPRKGLFAGVAMALGVAFWRAIDVRLGLFESAWPGRMLMHRSDAIFDFLLWGCVVTLWLDDPRRREDLRRILNPAVWPVAAGALLVVICCPVPLAPMLRAMLFPIVVVGTILHPSTWVGRFLELAPIRWFGRLSYSLYVWQSLFVGHDRATSSLLAPIQRLPWNVVAAFAAAVVSYYFIEIPAIRLGHRLSARISPTLAAPNLPDEASDSRAASGIPDRHGPAEGPAVDSSRAADGKVAR